MDERYDLCVIGAGTAGFAAAETARALGKRVLLVSGEGDLGGTCILRGCMPAKTLFSATERLGEVAGAEKLGVRSERKHVDVAALIARKRELTEYFAEDRIADLQSYPLARGCASFVAPNVIEVGERQIAADRFVIATGSHVVAPEVPGLAACGYITSDDALEMTQVPRSIAILGGGPVGCEFAQYFARLGTRVTLVQHEPVLLRNEDGDVGIAIAGVLEHDGVAVATGTTVVRCERDGDRDGADRIVTLEHRGARRDVRVETIMVATGRVPNVERLALERAGVALRDGAVAVDEYLRTSASHVYAAGDVIGRRCLVHVAAYAGKLAARNAFAPAPQAADFDRYETHAVYTQPQVAVAGLTERTCRERGIGVRVRRHPFRDVGKALVSNETDGFVKMLVRDDGRIAGVAIVGDDAIDLIGEAVAFIDAGASAADVAAMPHLHPAMGEIFARVAEDFLGDEAESLVELR